MKLTRSVSYALGILLQVHLSGRGELVTAAKISKGCKFPPRFLYRILRRLVDAGILNGISGPRGGYSLARSPGKISVLDVVLAIEGPIEQGELEAVHRKYRMATEHVNRICLKHAKAFERSLSKVSLAKLSSLKKA